jgi:3-deoxy-manno-octulosonate cytidylyltransferase (CMP-KDO synthetase)
VGLYAYTADALASIVQLAPSALEKAEALEQLRWLENGLPVRIGLTDHPSFCVDTPADLEEARKRVQ